MNTNKVTFVFLSDRKKRIEGDDPYAKEFFYAYHYIKENYKNEEIICVFQPHRISRLRNLKKEFSLSFKKADKVILCPVYSAGEKIKYNFNQNDFAKLISKKSKVQVINISNQKDLKNYFKKNLVEDEVVICMGAGSISSWVREIGEELK